MYITVLNATFLYYPPWFISYILRHVSAIFSQVNFPDQEGGGSITLR
jgi:hypothetical protein